MPEKIDTLYLPGKTVYKDTTIYRDIPGETVEVAVPVDVPVNIPDTSILAETTLARAEASLKDNVLSLKLEQLNQIYQFKLDSAIREHSDTIQIIKEIPYPVIKKAKPFYRHGFFVVLGLLCLFGLAGIWFLSRRK